MRSLVTRVVIVSLFFCPTAPLHAWGPEGHAIVADIAWNHLTPAAQQNLQLLLGSTALAAISTWPDEIRPVLPESAPWHYVDIPSAADGYLATRDCPQDNCAVAKIVFYAQVLRDPRFSPAAHLLALEFLVHFVGDLHQPFHALGDARGGNDIPVTVFGAQQCGNNTCKLHGVWDVDLIAHTGLDAQHYTDVLERRISSEHIDAGSADPIVWANESWKLAKEALVKPGANIDDTYYQRERPVVDQRLALAGLRLARILNQDLDPALAPPPPAPATDPAQSTAPASTPGTAPKIN